MYSAPAFARLSLTGAQASPLALPRIRLPESSKRPRWRSSRQFIGPTKIVETLFISK